MTENIENNEEIVVAPVEMTAGEMLRNARTTGRRKREIPTIAKQLCIREEFLDALENCNYSAIPELVYVLGFARNYAMELGLNPDEIVEKIKKEMGVLGDCAVDDADVSACAMPSIKEESWLKVYFVKAYQFIYQNWKWFLGGILLIAVVLTIVFWPQTEEVAPQVQPQVVPVEDVSAEPQYRLEVRERFGTGNRENANIIIQANADTGDAGSWIEVKDARGRTEISRVLMPGDVYYVPVGKGYKATFGNAGGVDIWVDGQLAPTVGAVHTKKADVILSPDSLMGKKSK